jgi:hypothetical protein
MTTSKASAILTQKVGPAVRKVTLYTHSPPSTTINIALSTEQIRNQQLHVKYVIHASGK